MKQELEEQLVKDFPQIFQDWHGNPMQTCMAWGLEVGDGWEPLIRKLCEDIMASVPGEGFRATQVKEKFGTLRCYVSGGTNEIYRLIHKAEKESGKICENCGNKDNVTTKGPGWIKTLCNECRNRRSNL
jgi:hypothetical protein